MPELAFFQYVRADSPLWLIETEPEGLATASETWSQTEVLVRILRGTKMHARERLFDEFAAVLQFPWYFGQNWDAFDECLSDMDWLPIDSGILLVIRDAADVLADEPAKQLQILTDTIAVARRTYAEPIERGETWDRPAVPFHVVLHAAPGQASDVTTRWTAAGAKVVPLPQHETPDD